MSVPLTYQWLNETYRGYVSLYFNEKSYAYRVNYFEGCTWNLIYLTRENCNSIYIFDTDIIGLGCVFQNWHLYKRNLYRSNKPLDLKQICEYSLSESQIEWWNSNMDSKVDDTFLPCDCMNCKRQENLDWPCDNEVIPDGLTVIDFRNFEPQDPICSFID